MSIIRRVLSITALLFTLAIILMHGAYGGDESDLKGPIAHIEVQHKRVGDTRYFQLSGIDSYMHVGSLVEYEWHIVMNDTMEYYLYGPFQTLEITGPAVYNITLKVRSDDTREDIKSMNITIKDDGFGSFLLNMRIMQDVELVEKLEMERTPPTEKQDLMIYHILIGVLSILVVLELILIVIILRKRSK